MGLLLFPSLFCKLICFFISPCARVCWYPLKNNTDRLSEGADVLCELLLCCVVHLGTLCFSQSQYSACA